ncbi:MAG TPA: TadE/TadG family type IV pilus assembly protein [Terriglobia bacterium]|nr:TadE/TadG family type IV pilus assembly protein [Terriglobia bacterium]
MNSCSAETQRRSPVRKRSERPGLHIHSRLGRLREIAVAELGAEVFEFAIVAPILLMLLIGIFWLGRAFNVYETITRAAREGARYAVLPSSAAAGNVEADTPNSSCSTNTNAYNNYIVPALKADNLDPKNVKNYCQKADWLENTYPKQCGISISFKYQVQMTIPFTSVNATTINIPANAQMRLENQPTGAKCPQ